MADWYTNIGAAVAEAQTAEWETSARAAVGQQTDYLGSVALEQLTGIPASTWRYWAHIGSGPPSFKLGRRRVWAKSEVMTWIAEQRQATGTGGDEIDALRAGDTGGVS
jgi:predicted DNA-binding transcriptional regulator AlpA